MVQVVDVQYGRHRTGVALHTQRLPKGGTNTPTEQVRTEARGVREPVRGLLGGQVGASGAGHGCEYENVPLQGSGRTAGWFISNDGEPPSLGFSWCPHDSRRKVDGLDVSLKRMKADLCRPLKHLLNAVGVLELRARRAPSLCAPSHQPSQTHAAVASFGEAFTASTAPPPMVRGCLSVRPPLGSVCPRSVQ